MGITFCPIGQAVIFDFLMITENKNDLEMLVTFKTAQDMTRPVLLRCISANFIGYLRSNRYHTNT